MYMYVICIFYYNYLEFYYKYAWFYLYNKIYCLSYVKMQLFCQRSWLKSLKMFGQKWSTLLELYAGIILDYEQSLFPSLLRRKMASRGHFPIANFYRSRSTD